jgi:hypothetical protein
MRIDWAAFQACLDEIPGNTVVNDEEAIGKSDEDLTKAIQEATAASAPKRDPVPTSGFIYPLVFRMKKRLKDRLRRQWQVSRDPALIVQINRLQRSVTYRLNE